MFLEVKHGISDDYEYTEAIKTLRTNLQFCGTGIKVIMFTSAMPDEGKSDISFAMADAMAQIGKKTLLIDADIRKSVLSYRYHLKRKLNGLSQFLSGQKTLDEVLYHTDNELLDIIFAGPYSPNPAELLEEEIFGATIQKLKNEYDYIIIDTPPMGALIDGAIVARHCDGAVLVIESGAVSWRIEQTSRLCLRQCRALLRHHQKRAEHHLEPYVAPDLPSCPHLPGGGHRLPGRQILRRAGKHVPAHPGGRYGRGGQRVVKVLSDTKMSCCTLRAAAHFL